jgi:ATP-dependent Clp protease adapter protein ClpS
MGTVESPAEVTKIEGVNLESAKARHAVEALNNEVTTFLQVIGVFTGVCGYDRPTAEGYTMKIHMEGKAVCFWGPKERCEDVVRAFGKIGVKARILEV